MRVSVFRSLTLFPFVRYNADSTEITLTLILISMCVSACLVEQLDMYFKIYQPKTC